ncbi:hypothetical protein BH24ACT23_BH24ACT23_09750 [soil metagenome]
MTDSPDFGLLLKRMTDAEVRFILVGGMAVIGHGNIRATGDIDMVPAPDRANLDRLASILVELEGKVTVGERVASADSIAVFLRAGDKTLVETRLGAVDVLQGLPQIPRYQQLAEGAVRAEVEGVQVQICSLDHLLAMKRAADRPMDRLDIEALEIAHRRSPEE